MDKLEDTGERMIPEFHKGGLIYAEHIIRYEAAVDLVGSKDVLDIACGSGYGTQLLAKSAKKIYGVDISPEAVDYAREHFGAKNIEFMVGSAEEIPIADNSVDVVITFETIEHVGDYKKFLQEIKRVLRPDGLAIISTPNDKEFAEGNHFHLHEFEYRELTDLIHGQFKNIAPYFQSTWKYVALTPPELLTKPGKMELEIENLAPISRDQTLYFFLICSNRKISESIKPRAALGGHYSDRLVLASLQQERDLVAELNKVGSELRSIKKSRHYNFALKMLKIKQFLMPWENRN